MESAQSEQEYANLSGPYEKRFTLACAFHECSCSIPEMSFGRATGNYSIDQLSAKTTSNITINGSRVSLPAPPLNISFGFHHFYSKERKSNTGATSASEYWSGTPFSRFTAMRDYQGDYSPASGGIFCNGFEYTEDFIIETGVCIASEAYSWGSSSLLLLTFCVYTILFAMTLMVLQTDVYWNSRLDRTHQSYSIYADILTIAETLKSIPEYNLLDLLQSPKALDEKVGGRKHGTRFDTRGLQPSRLDETEVGRENVRKRLEKEARHRDEHGLLSAQGGMELQLIEPVQQETRLEEDGLMSRVSHEQASRDSVKDITMSGAIQVPCSRLDSVTSLILFFAPSPGVLFNPSECRNNTRINVRANSCVSGTSFPPRLSTP
jgi:hypothetical protein